MQTLSKRLNKFVNFMGCLASSNLFDIEVANKLQFGYRIFYETGKIRLLQNSIRNTNNLLQCFNDSSHHISKMTTESDQCAPVYEHHYNMHTIIFKRMFYLNFTVCTLSTSYLAVTLVQSERLC